MFQKHFLKTIQLISTRDEVLNRYSQMKCSIASWDWHQMNTGRQVALLLQSELQTSEHQALARTGATIRVENAWSTANTTSSTSKYYPKRYCKHSIPSSFSHQNASNGNQHLADSICPQLYMATKFIGKPLKLNLTAFGHLNCSQPSWRFLVACTKLHLS